jgi:hypothetical protein
VAETPTAEFGILHSSRSTPVAVGPGECLDATYRATPLLRLQRPPFLDARGQAGEIEPRGPETGVACPVLDEPVRYAEVRNGQLQAIGRQHCAMPEPAP